MDLRVFELLVSRLCHDLVSPVGAVKSGLELFTEFGDDPDGETMALINSSVDQASRKLQFFRLAYGQAGSQREDVKLAEAVDLLDAVCGNQRTRIEGSGDEMVAGAGNGKLLLNLGLVAAETIPRGGVIEIGIAGGSLRASAKGEGAALDPALSEALSLCTPVDVLTPKSVQGYFTGILARRADTEVYSESGSDKVDLAIAVKG